VIKKKVATDPMKNLLQKIDANKKITSVSFKQVVDKCTL
jgi:hypothetical protein